MSAVRKARAAPVMPTLFEIGRQIVALGDINEDYDQKLLNRGLPERERCRIEKAKSILFSQEEALVDLGLTMIPETVRDAVAQLVLADRRLDTIVACDLDYEDAIKIAADALHVIRGSLPLLARAAQISLAEVAGDGMLVMMGAVG